MYQLVEGIDNEITAILVFVTFLCAIVIPFYILRPSRLQNQATQQSQQPQDGQPNQYNETNSSTEPSSHSLIEPLVNSSNHNPGRQSDLVNKTSSSSSGEHVGRTSINDNENSSRTSSMNSSESSITLKIMFQETFMFHDVNKNITLAQLKQLAFPVQYDEGKTIRMIHAGRVLADDTRSLNDLGLKTGAVLHSVISEASSSTHSESTEDSSITRDLDLSPYLVLICTSILMLLWCLNFMYYDYFSITSMVVLVFFTVLFVMFVHAS